MKIAVIGPGAIGSIFASYLFQGGLDVTLIDHRPDRVAQIKQKGIFLDGVRGQQQIKVPITVKSSTIGAVDLVIVCVKAYHTKSCIEQHHALIGPTTTVWSVQNGIGNTDIIAELIPADQIVGGSTTLGAYKTDPGKVFHAAEGDTFIGELSGRPSERTKNIAKQLSVAGLAVQATDKIQEIIWRKLIINVGINALTAILRVKNGELINHPPARQLMERAVHEAIGAAAAQGILFDQHAIQARVKEVAKTTALNRSSMLSDVLAKRQTEVSMINGAIAKMVEAPVNLALTELVQTIENTYSVFQKADNEV
jgi:2-dehydropantoate 2-reductase